MKISAFYNKGKIKRSPVKLLLLLIAVIFLFFIFDLIFPISTQVPYSQIITSQEGDVLGSFLSKDDMWRFKAELKDISPVLIKTVIFKEDRYFYYHVGINPISVVRALFTNIFSGHRVSGASTITMQLARMLEPKDRTYFNKFLEMFRALQLEVHYSKDEILTMYLNHLPYGGNIEGAETASILYFGVKPDKLSLAQAAALSVVPQNPNKYRLGEDNARITEERNKVIKMLARKKAFPPEQIAAAKSETLDAYRREIPRLAPHLLYRLNSKYPDIPVVKTYIRSYYQQSILDIVANHMINFKTLGIYNASVIVIDNKTRNVVSYIGSGNFFDKEHSGQVDGVTSLRSPGSTLKPLAYAMGFDAGVITPKSCLLDVPILNSEYSPDNFSGTFKGEITAEQALIKSLNVPAVRLLQMIDYNKLIDKLIKAGFGSIKQQKSKLGLSVILGGCGVTLEEMAMLYSDLANLGNIGKLRYTTLDKADSSKDRVASPEAAYMIADILSDASRPDMLFSYLSARDIPLIAWKTGTSYGRRDAWSIGYNPNYTVAVWTGNFSGKPSEELTGSQIATPLMFEIFRLIEKKGTIWYQVPENLYKRDVDEETGLLPGEFTKHTVKDYYIPLVSSIKTSDNYVKVSVSMNEKVSYCNDCLPAGNYKEKVYPKLDPELLSFYEKYQLPYEKIPPHNPKCPRISTGEPPVISSPNNGQDYILEKGNSQKIMLQCYTKNDVEYVYWFINNKFYAKALHNEKIFFEPDATGSYKISCTDELGRNSDATIKISYY